MEQVLDFDGPRPTHEQRVAFLEEAAASFDGRGSKLGLGGKPLESDEGKLARMFAEDRATLGRPEVFRLAPDGLEAVRDGVPVTAEELSRRNAHYWMSFPVALWTAANRGFNQIEVRIAFNEASGEDDAQRPTAVDAVPDHEVLTRFEASGEMSLGVNANFAFATPKVPLDALGVPVTAEASAEAGGAAKLIFAPRAYAVHAARVSRSGTGHPFVFWRLERESFVEENDPGLRVVARVPLPAKRLHVTAEMLAVRHANLFGAGLRHAISDLPEWLRDFFNGGTPIAASGDWDLSEHL